VSESTIPFFGIAREFAVHRHEIMTRIEDALATGQALQGEPVFEFETRMATLGGRKHGMAVNSCTDALFFALKAAGVQPGDEVLVTDFTFVASASCIARLGAIPVFVDVDDTYNMDLEKAAALITPKTKVMVFVHLYGQMMDPDRLETFARQHDLILVEDAAQAIGAMFNGRPAGSLGLVSCVSFDPTKPVSAPGSGGIVLTDDPGIAARVRLLRYHGKAPTGEFVEIGYNSQMPTLTAAVLNFKLDHNAEWLDRRREIAAYYIDRLSELGLVVPVEQPGSLHIYHKFVVRTSKRDTLMSDLTQHNIQVRIHYSKPLHQQPCFSQTNYPDDWYPKSLSFSQTVLSLPIHPFLSDAEVEAVVGAIRDAC
jgi:dTDP-4-amino-4,6-dideoxygalactose transaminase